MRAIAVLPCDVGDANEPARSAAPGLARRRRTHHRVQARQRADLGEIGLHARIAAHRRDRRGALPLGIDDDAGAVVAAISRVDFQPGSVRITVSMFRRNSAISASCFPGLTFSRLIKMTGWSDMAPLHLFQTRQGRAAGAQTDRRAGNFFTDRPSRASLTTAPDELRLPGEVALRSNGRRAITPPSGSCALRGEQPGAAMSTCPLQLLTIQHGAPSTS